MRKPRGFQLSEGRRAKPRFLVVSAGAHVLLVIAMLAAYRGFQNIRHEHPGVVAIAIPAAAGGGGGRPAPPLGRHRETPAPTPAPVPQPLPIAPAAPVGPPPAPAALPEGSPGGVLGGTPGGNGIAMRPGRGDPRLWAYPMYIPEGGGRPINIDSLVRHRMELMANIMDSVARNGGDSLAPYNPPYRTPSWTFESGGRTYGIDNQWIHLGIFKIPTAALALIPIPVQGNYEQNRLYEQQMQMRADILRAAARSEAEEDFRRAVAQIRQRKDQERQDQRERERQQHERNRTNDQPIP